MRRTTWQLAGFGIAALGAGLLAGGQPVRAEQVRIRGHIETVDRQVLTILARDGREMKLQLADGVSVTAIVKASLADIGPNSYVGTAAMPQPDGTLKALEVHIFPETLRRAGEGFRDFDLEPGSTMTNATVSGPLTGSAGPVMKLTYPGGEKTVVIPPGTPVVTTAPASLADVKPGVGIIVFGADRQADGTFRAARITVGRDGVDPPM